MFAGVWRCRTIAARNDDTVIAFDRRQSPIAAEIAAACAAPAPLVFSVVTELPLSNGRRADVVALSSGGDITIVEIKSCLLARLSDPPPPPPTRPPPPRPPGGPPQGPTGGGPTGRAWRGCAAACGGAC